MKKKLGSNTGNRIKNFDRNRRGRPIPRNIRRRIRHGKRKEEKKKRVSEKRRERRGKKKKRREKERKEKIF